jgi:septal ring factor EnvC (AmiA/AmiB activator)|nr:MAG TPA: Fusion of phage phi29 Gp7 division, FtsL, CELL CYCLE [Bacteriophage sp.]
MDGPISRAEHEEFARRIDAQEKRQDRRLELLEENVREIGALTVSVQKLAQSLQSMVKEQEQQGRRLQALESRDGEKWRKLMGYIATALTSGAVTLLLSHLVG